MSGLPTRSLRTVLLACLRLRPLLSPRKFLLILMTVLVSACGPEADVRLESLASPKPPVPPANVSGRVADAGSGADIAGATVSMEAAPVETLTGTIFPPPVTDTTDADGLFDLADVRPSGSALMRVTAPGYMDAYVVVNAVGGVTAAVLVELLPIAEQASFDPAVGGTVTDSDSPAQLAVPAGSLELAAGGAATSPVTVSVTPINMAQEITTAPGDFLTDAGRPLETWGAVTVAATDATGAAVDLAAGQTATLRIPFSSRNVLAPPPTLTLFRFDTDTGRWIDSGITATYQAAVPTPYYEADIDALGIWMAAEVIDPSSFITGCVVNEVGGARVPNVRVSAEGISYSGISSAITDGSGNFRVEVKAGSDVIVNGGLGNYLTNTLSETASVTAGATVALPECLTLSALSGAPRITLSWGDQPSDLDSHIFAPDGTHVSYMDLGTLLGDPYVGLDVDDTTSYGPEVVTLRRLMVGTYTYGVRNYSGTDSPGITDSPSLVELRRGLEVRRFNPAAGEDADTDLDWWVVFQFTVDAQCNVTVAEINTWSEGGDDGPTDFTLPATVTRAYCTPP